MELMNWIGIKILKNHGLRGLSFYFINPRSPFIFISFIEFLYQHVMNGVLRLIPIFFNNQLAHFHYD